LSPLGGIFRQIGKKKKRNIKKGLPEKREGVKMRRKGPYKRFQNLLPQGILDRQKVLGGKKKILDLERKREGGR